MFFWFGFSQDVVFLKAKHGVPTACPKAGGGGLPPFKALAKGIFMYMQASERILFVYALCCKCLKILALHAPSSAITSQLLSFFGGLCFMSKRIINFWMLLQYVACLWLCGASSLFTLLEIIPYVSR